MNITIWTLGNVVCQRNYSRFIQPSDNVNAIIWRKIIAVVLRNLCSCGKKAWKKTRERMMVKLWIYENDICELRRNSNTAVHTLWFSYIHNFIIFLSRVYHEPIQRPAPSWLVSLIGRALHRYRRGQGFESRTSLNFFQAFFSQLHKLRIQLRWSTFK